MRGLSLSQRNKLSDHPFVSKITEKSISFTEEFKKLMLSKSQAGLTQEQYFNNLLGVKFFTKKYVDTCLNRWRKEVKFKSVPKFKPGRRKDRNKMTIEELRAENALQREMLAELKKIHGLTDEDTFGF